MSYTRPSRRAKQKQVSEVVGLLPQEQAALTKALYASLHEQKSPDKTTPTKSEKEERQSSTPTGKKRHNVSGTPLGRPKKSRLEQNFETQSSDSSSSNSDFNSPLSSWKRTECRSPSIYGLSQSSLSSPCSVPSSPMSFSSPGGSLRLELSFSSWSDSSDSPSRSSSIWSPSSYSLKGKTTKKTKKIVKGKKNASLRQDHGGVGKSTVQDHGVGAKGSRKVKSHLIGDNPSVDEILKRVSQEYDRSLGKFSTPNRTKTNSGGKANKSPKQTFESKLKAKLTSKNRLDNRGGGKTKKGKKTASHKSKKRKGDGAKDGVTSTREEMKGESESQRTPQDSCHKAQNNNESSSHMSTPCTYQAQRKFASNHTPPPRNAQGKFKDLSSLQEIPKTEDFITFLCLRGASKIPFSLHKFNFPWTPYQKPKKNGQIRSDSGKVSKGKSASKRLLFTPSSGAAIRSGSTIQCPQTACDLLRV